MKVSGSKATVGTNSFAMNAPTFFASSGMGLPSTGGYMSPREEKIIKMRFGLQDGSEHTLEEVGQQFAVTRERIRQIEAKALRKLRHPSRSEKLRSFLDSET